MILTTIAGFFAGVTEHAEAIIHLSPALIAIGGIGVWRWSMWLAKRIPSLFYRPIVNDHTCSATIVTTVYNEDPELFARAVESWLANGPNRVIAVVDVTDQACMRVARRYPLVEVIPNAVPGKRHKLATGVDLADTDIVVLVDSDVIWDRDVLRKLMMPFADPAIGGVSARAYMIPSEAVSRPEIDLLAVNRRRVDRGTVWERLADVYLDLRFSTEVPATSRFGQAVSCLSGRTSAYRTKLLQGVREAFVNETFCGKQCVSGDDKRYTSLILEGGYRTWYQLDARVYSTFKPDLGGFLKQRLRWCRNSFRSDLRALSSRWLWRHPYLAIVLLDKNLGLFTQLNGPVIFFAAWHYGNWQLALSLILWWHLSRALKIWPHLRRYPQDWPILSLYIGFTFFLTLIKLYAFATMNKQGWLTRSEEALDRKVVHAAPA